MAATACLSGIMTALNMAEGCMTALNMAEGFIVWLQHQVRSYAQPETEMPEPALEPDHAEMPEHGLEHRNHEEDDLGDEDGVDMQRAAEDAEPPTRV